MAKREINRLNNLAIRRALAAGNPQTLCDGGGLNLTISDAGTASWIFRYRQSGRGREATMARYPDMTLQAARNRAAELRVAVKNGGDPAAEAIQAKREARESWTVRDLVKHYREEALPDLRPNTRKWQEPLLKSIEQRLGSLLVQKVRSRDIVATIEATNRPAGGKRRIHAARFMQTTLSSLFKLARGRKLIDVSPCAGLSLDAIAGKRPPKRERLKLSSEELALLMPTFERTGRQNGLMFKIMLATAVRSNEILAARWEHIDFGAATWTVHDEQAKTGSGFVIPLAPPVIVWLKELQTLACNSPFVLPARLGGGMERHASAGTGREQLKKLIASFDGKVRRFTFHDLRSTARSYFGAMGAPVVVAERCLNHKLVRNEMIDVYDQHDYLEERRELLTRWADLLSRLERKEPLAEVVPISRTAAVPVATAAARAA